MAFDISSNLGPSGAATPRKSHIVCRARGRATSLTRSTGRSVPRTAARRCAESRAAVSVTAVCERVCSAETSRCRMAPWAGGSRDCTLSSASGISSPTLRKSEPNEAESPRTARHSACPVRTQESSCPCQ
ncbi:PAN domain-containing protein [Streptomyces reniochalinae]|uniref:PAN domain-containing protein n=1 Tax=Streptomyces reniochalinae TaxID=2250578 RepID=UPI003CCC7B8C